MLSLTRNASLNNFTLILECCWLLRFHSARLRFSKNQSCKRRFARCLLRNRLEIGVPTFVSYRAGRCLIRLEVRLESLSFDTFAKSWNLHFWTFLTRPRSLRKRRTCVRSRARSFLVQTRPRNRRTWVRSRAQALFQSSLVVVAVVVVLVLVLVLVLVEVEVVVVVVVVVVVAVVEVVLVFVVVLVA